MKPTLDGGGYCRVSIMTAETIVLPDQSQHRSVWFELAERPSNTRLPLVLYSALRADPSLSHERLAEMFGIALSTVERIMLFLYTAGIVSRRRRGRNPPPYEFPRDTAQPMQ
jgi:transcription initiation factor IIE alpha subunit